MIAVFRPALLAALVAASIPAVAEGQDPSSDSLPDRMVLLERQVAYLEERVRVLESLIKVKPSQEPLGLAPAKWRDLANWRQLRRGMKSDQVLALLGAPERVDGGAFTFWRWESAEVRFYEGRLDGWSEPRQ